MTMKNHVGKNTISVGATPVRKYASWEEHRRALRREARKNRARRLVTLE